MTSPLQIAASQGPEALGKYLASLSPYEYEQHWQVLDAAVVANAGYTFEGFKAFARLMMYDPAAGMVIDIAKHHEDWVRTSFEYNRVLVLAPPESAKTTILGILFAAFTIGHKPVTQSMVVSVSDDQAEKIVGTIVTYIEHHPAWRMCFPDIVPDKKRGWGFDKGFFVKKRETRTYQYGDWLRERGTRKDPTIFGAGYGNRAIIGKRVDGVMILDDLMDVDTMRSDAELQALQDTLDRTLSTRPEETGKMIMVGTPWREDDVYATSISKGLYKVFVTPALREEEQLDGSKVTVSYWPEVWTVDRLEEKRIELGERAFQIMYMMNLDAAKGTILKSEWLNPPLPMEKIDKTWPVYYGVDFAYTSVDIGLTRRTSTGKSYFALAKIAVAPFGLVLIGGVRAQQSLAESIETMKAQAEIDNPRKIFIESWGAGEMFLQQLLRETSLPVMAHKDTKDKATRFMRMARHFEQKRVLLSASETEFLHKFREEWVSFGSPHSTSDTLDATFMALEAAGFTIYQVERRWKKEQNPQPKKPSPWGGTWGMPRSRFSPGRG